jgi:hypothetical protein
MNETARDSKVEQKPFEKWAKSSALRTLRGESCYPTLRLLIELTFWLGCVLSGGFAFAVLLVQGQELDIPLLKDVSAVPVLVAAVLAIVVLCAWREAAFLLIDIADVLVADRSDRLEIERSRILDAASPNVGI